MVTTAAKTRNVNAQATLSVAILRAIRLIDFVERSRVVSIANTLSVAQKRGGETAGKQQISHSRLLALEGTVLLLLLLPLLLDANLTVHALDLM